MAEDESPAAAHGRDRDRQGAERPAGLQCGRRAFLRILGVLLSFPETASQGGKGEGDMAAANSVCFSAIVLRAGVQLPQVGHLNFDVMSRLADFKL